MNKLSFKNALRRFFREFSSLGYNVKTYVLYGVLYDIMFNLYKPFASKFTERLGGTELHISLITSLPGIFAVIALIPGSVFLNKLTGKQKATALLLGLSRFFLVIMALAPLLPHELRAWAFVIALSAMNLPDSVSQASLQSFLGEIFPPRRRADAIAIRSRFGNLATSLALIVSSIMLNFAASSNDEKIKIYQLFYIVAFLFGVMEVSVFLKLKPGKISVPASTFRFRSSFPKIIKNRTFVSFCAVSFIFHFAYFMGFPLANIVQIKELGASELWVGASTLVSVLAIVASSRFWGRMITKRGTGWVLAFTAAGLSLNTVLIWIAPNPAVYALFAVVGGWFTCGLNLGVLNGLLESTPDEDRVVYVGVFQTFVNLTLAVAPLFAHYLCVRNGVYASLGVAGALRLASGIIIFFVYHKRKVIA